MTETIEVSRELLIKIQEKLEEAQKRITLLEKIVKRF
jgi:hypothetical protein